MKTKKELLILFMFVFSCIFQGLYAQQGKSNSVLKSAQDKELKLPYMSMALSAKYIGPTASDPDWYLWCFSPIMGKDNKVHAFVSRWPAADGDNGWSGKNAEIAHYVSDKPEGPFTYVKTVMKSDMFPDTKTMIGPHNPRLEYVDGKYVLLYICQDASQKGIMMRIGMMVADDLNGPWHFAGKDGILVDSSTNPEHWTYNAVIGVYNPAFLKIKDKYYIYFNSGTPEHMKSKYGYAVSDKLEGPYALCDTPITDNISYIEDAQAFSVDDTYYLLTTDNLGGNTGVFGNLILWKSKNGLEFKRSEAKTAMGVLFDYWGTEKEQQKLLETPGLYIHHPSGKLERPAILKIDGKPAYLYGVGDINLNGGKVSESYVFKINWNKGE